MKTIMIYFLSQKRGVTKVMVTVAASIEEIEDRGICEKAYCYFLLVNIEMRVTP